MKVLFCCPLYFDFYKVIEKGIQDNYECEIKTIVLKEFRYKNIFEKIKKYKTKFTPIKNNLIFSKNQKLIKPKLK